MKVTLTTLQPDNLWVVSFKFKSYNQEEAIEVMNSLVKGLSNNGKFEDGYWINSASLVKKEKHDD